MLVGSVVVLDLHGEGVAASGTGFISPGHQENAWRHAAGGAGERVRPCRPVLPSGGHELGASTGHLS